MKKYKLLVTSRDSAATFNIIEIVKAALKDDSYHVSIYAQHPAIYHYQAAGLNVNIVPFGSIKRKEAPDYIKMLNYCDNIIALEKPDIVLTGLSTPFDGGIDEAIVASAKGKIPSLLMQDFWGEINQFFGSIPDFCLCLDEHSKKITEEKFNVQCSVIGSPRHSVLGRKELPKLKKKLKENNNIASTVPVIGFFGQALHHFLGYHTIIHTWSKCISELQDVIVGYRPHPRESSLEINITKDILASYNIKYELLDHKKVEDSLLMSDVVCSIFSNCTYDACYLNYYSLKPLIVPILLYYNDEIKEYISRYISNFPYLKANLALGVEREETLMKTIQDALFSSKTKQTIWKNNSMLMNPEDAPRNALNVIKKIVGTSNVVFS